MGVGNEKYVEEHDVFRYKCSNVKKTRSKVKIAVCYSVKLKKKSQSQHPFVVVLVVCGVAGKTQRESESVEGFTDLGFT